MLREVAVEHVYVFGEDGALRGHASDFHPSLVRIPARLGQAARGAVLTHNHPGGRSFSQQDVVTLMDLELLQMRVITRHFRAWVEPPPGGWTVTRRRAVFAAVTDTIPVLVQRMQRQVASGMVAPEAADRDFEHRLWTQVAEHGLLRYGTESWPT